ncbi:uncharacterized protein DDB_G0288805-like [Octopus sinensis]|uniref:Uncharacterized protein DDB_G0288805-like n=1 Tax=Octopus sinensis TaxID=2607531 RepID=A0A6P7THX4_9MOLL|nr:uncharacterized protein DDB_G0288805-like [Octopus sinensis]XP_029656902.1 uncharacterized protein DDB_G0288805-like [Octopus sinensis]
MTISKSTKNYIWFVIPFGKQIKSNLPLQFRKAVAKNFARDSSNDRGSIDNSNIRNSVSINNGNISNSISQINNRGSVDGNNDSISIVRDIAGDSTTNNNNNNRNSVVINASSNGNSNQNNRNSVLISEENPNRLKFLSSNSKIKNSIYQCKISSITGVFFYIGATTSRLFQRISNHYSTFRDKRKQHTTGLSKLVWRLKDSNITFKLD